MKRLKLMIAPSVVARCVAANPEDFFRAIRADAHDTLRALSSDRTALNRPDSHGISPLHYAAVVGTAESLNILIAAGANVNARNAEDATPDSGSRFTEVCMRQARPREQLTPRSRRQCRLPKARETITLSRSFVFFTIFHVLRTGAGKKLDLPGSRGPRSDTEGATERRRRL
jgi:hypothetical protein